MKTGCHHCALFSKTYVILFKKNKKQFPSHGKFLFAISDTSVSQIIYFYQYLSTFPLLLSSFSLSISCVRRVLSKSGNLC